MVGGVVQRVWVNGEGMKGRGTVADQAITQCATVGDRQAIAPCHRTDRFRNTGLDGDRYAMKNVSLQQCYMCNIYVEWSWTHGDMQTLL